MKQPGKEKKKMRERETVGNQEEVENSQQSSPLLVTLPQCVNLPRLQDSHVVDTHAHEHRLINSPVAIASPSCSNPCNASNLPITLGDQSIPSQDGPPCDQSHSSGVGLSSNPGSNGSARDGSCHELLDMSFTGHALDQVGFTDQDQYTMQDQSLDSLTGRVRQCDIASSSQGHGQIEIETKKSRVKCFLKLVNYQHVMPTRYTLDVDLKDVVSVDSLQSKDQKVSACKATKAKLEERFKTGKNRWFFTKLRF
ncbi:hypothetical protein V6N11_044240 [Hibiscus sabdariffa]|uniref:60S ribosomal protein L27 n=1 Tax=Hibiscus sabdariffa TaxID=183260 RepID=A0ABR2REM4_9ROSI